MRIAVTGAAGKIGRFVTAELSAHGHEVVGVDRAPAPHRFSTFHRADIQRTAALEQAFAGCEAVVHLAAVSRPWLAGEEQLMRVNAMGAFHTLSAAAACGVRRFVLASSEATLGFALATRPIAPEYVPIDERHPLRPQHGYGVSKLVAEEMSRSFTLRGAMSTICLRTCYVWSLDWRENALGALTDEERGRGALWAYVDARDCARAYRLACEVDDVDHAVLFIAAPDACSLTPTPELLARHFPSVRMPKGASDDASLISSERARSVLGFEAAHRWRDQVDVGELRTVA